MKSIDRWSRGCVLLAALLFAGCSYPMQQAPEKPAAHPLQFEGVPMRASLEEVQRAEPGFQLAQRSVDGHVQMLYGKELHPNGIEATTSSAALYNGRLVEVLVKF